jgi:hypothetical protein
MQARLKDLSWKTQYALISLATPVRKPRRGHPAGFRLGRAEQGGFPSATCSVIRQLTVIDQNQRR